MAEYGPLPYPSKIAKLLPTLPLLPLPEEEEEQETTVEIIELDDLLEPFSFHHSVSEPEVHAVLPTTPIVPSVPIERILLLCPAPTFVNELRLAPTAELNE